MISYEIHRDPGVVIISVDGDITRLELEAVIDLIVEDPGYAPEMRGVADLRRVAHGIAPEEAMALARYVIDHDLTHARWAILAAAPKATAVSLFYEGGAAGQHRVEVFSTAAKAAAFLGLDLSGVLAE